MNFHEDFLDTLRTLVIDHYETRIEASGLELDDFVDRVLDSIDDNSEILCDAVIEFIDNELGE